MLDEILMTAPSASGAASSAPRQTRVVAGPARDDPHGCSLGGASRAARPHGSALRQRRVRPAAAWRAGCVARPSAGAPRARPSRSPGPDRSCGPAPRARGRRRGGSHDVRRSRATAARAPRTARARTCSPSRPSSSMPIDQSLQPSRPSQLERPACQARSSHRHELQHLAVAPHHEVGRDLEPADRLEVRMRRPVERVGEQALDRRRRRTRPGGRLIECSTTVSTRAPAGRGPKLGDGTRVAPRHQPSCHSASRRIAARSRSGRPSRTR